MITIKTKSTSQTPRPLTTNAILLAITALALLASPGSRGDALCRRDLSTYWTRASSSGPGDWFDPSNWTNGVPAFVIPAYIDNGGRAQITTATTALACELTLGEFSGTSGTLSVDDSTLNACSNISVGSQGNGKLIITNGGVVSNPVASFIAALSGSSSAVTVDGQNQGGTKSQWTISGGVLYVGGTTNAGGGTGVLTVTNGGTITAASAHVYKSGTLTGNGTVNTTSGTTVDGTCAPRGTLTISGGFTCASTANMQCNVTSTSWDRAEVSGTATLDGRLSVTLTGFFTGDFPLLHASTLVGTFSSYSFTYTGCLAPSIVYDYVNGYVKLHVESTCN